MEIIDAEAEVVRRVYRNYLDGISCEETAAQLAAEGVLSRQGKPLGPETLRSWLKKESYTGTLTLGRWISPSRESGSHFLYTVSASGGERVIRTQEEIDYPEYFTADDDRPAGEPPTAEGPLPQPPVGGAAQKADPRSADRLNALRSRAVPKREEVEARIGVSLPKMLLPYLVDAHEITIVDPYLRMRHQIANIHDILIHLVQAVGLAAPPRVHLTTGRAEPAKATEQTQLLNDLCETWGHFGVEIDYEFTTDIHDRVIKTDTGWVIDLGRGLDVYERFQALSRFDPRFDLMELRRTKGFTFNAQRAE